MKRCFCCDCVRDDCSVYDFGRGIAVSMCSQCVKKHGSELTAFLVRFTELVFDGLAASMKKAQL